MLQNLSLYYFLFLAYLILFSFLIIRIKFITNSGLSKPVLIGLFCFKILAGFIYAWFYNLPAYHTYSDSFRFYNFSLSETDMLLKNPILFVKDIFTYGYETSGNIFVGHNSYWNDLKSNLIIKLLAVCNVFSFKNYYINILFFNFIFFIGLIAFYRLMYASFKINKYILLIPVFFIPSFMFWCSGIHKDGLIFSSIGLILYLFNNNMEHGFKLKRSLLLIALLLLVFLLRNYVALLLILSLFSWLFSAKTPKKFMSFLMVYFVAIVLFFISPFIHSKLNFPNYISTKQQEFAMLPGGSMTNNSYIEPNLKGFINYLPNALNMAFIQPHIFQLKNKSYIPAAMENIFISLIIIAFLFFRNKNIKISSLVYTCLFFSLSMLLIAGYTVTFSGAIVRYRSLVLPIFLAPMIALIDYKKIKHHFGFK